MGVICSPRCPLLAIWSPSKNKSSTTGYLSTWQFNVYNWIRQQSDCTPENETAKATSLNSPTSAYQGPCAIMKAQELVKSGTGNGSGNWNGKCTKWKWKRDMCRSLIHFSEYYVSLCQWLVSRTVTVPALTSHDVSVVCLWSWLGQIGFSSQCG